MADLTIGSLCSGYGGLDLAVMDVLDAEVAWHAQYDPDDKHQYAARVLERHWPGVPNLGDITSIDWAAVAPVDILTAGFPCQPVSNAGKRKGHDDDRWLWPHVESAIRVLRPRLVLLENVAALVVRGLDRVLAGLASIGFDASWTCLRASDIGAAHRRERIFILAWPADAPCPRLETRREGRPRRNAAADASDLGYERGRPARLRGTGPADGRVAAADPARVGHGHTGQAGVGGVPAAAVGGGTPAPADPQGIGRFEGRPEPTRVERGSDAPLGGGQAPADTRGVEPERRGGPGLVGGEAAAEPRQEGERERAGHAPEHRGPAALDWGPYGPAVERWAAVMGRHAPAPTEPGRNGPRLSATFVEWLMGAAEGHVTAVPGIPRNAQLKALGNGVVPQQGAAALRLLLDRAGGGRD